MGLNTERGVRLPPSGSSVSVRSSPNRGQDPPKELVVPNRIVKNPVATTVVILPCGGVSVTYHQTEVVRIEKGVITLNSGGWRTSTTKHRINQYTPDDIGVYQKGGEWFVTTPKGEFPFHDGWKYNPNV